MPLELSESPAIIKDINPRKEGAGDDKVLAVDLKLQVEECAHCVLPYFDPALRGFLFDGDAIRFPLMDSIKWDGKNENMELDICGFSFIGVKLSRFEITPFLDFDGQDRDDYTDIQKVRVTFTASFNPQGREMATIAEMLGEPTPVSILPRQQELPV